MEKTWSLGGQMATDNYRAGWTHTDGEWARNLIPSRLPDTSPFLAGRYQQTSDFKRAKEKGGGGAKARLTATLHTTMAMISSEGMQRN